MQDQFLKFQVIILFDPSVDIPAGVIVNSLCEFKLRALFEPNLARYLKMLFFGLTSLDS